MDSNSNNDSLQPWGVEHLQHIKQYKTAEDHFMRSNSPKLDTCFVPIFNGPVSMYIYIYIYNNRSGLFWQRKKDKHTILGNVMSDQYIFVLICTSR